MGTGDNPNEELIFINDMNILLAADIYPPQTGGPATYVVSLARGLVKHGVSVKIVSLNPGSDESLFGAMQHARSRNKIVRYLQYIFLLWKNSRDVDVVYAMGPVNAGLPALLVSAFRKKKFVVKVVGDYAWEQGVQRFGLVDDIDTFQNKRAQSIPIFVLRYIERIVVRHADFVIVPSLYLGHMVVAWGASVERTKVIYNAVDTEHVESAQKSEGDIWFVYAGRIVPWKGIRALVNAVARVRDEYPNARLIVVGDGPQYDEILQMVREQNLGETVILTGSLSHSQALSYIYAADAFVLNSGYEGLSHVLLEALSAGIPVLASDKGGNSELAELVEGITLFPYNDVEEIVVALTGILQKKFRSSHGLPAEFFFETMIGETYKELKRICKS